MTSSNGNIFRVTGHLCGEFPAQRPVTRSFDVFFNQCLYKRLSKQWWGWWSETTSRLSWRQCNVIGWYRSRVNWPHTMTVLIMCSFIGRCVCFLSIYNVWMVRANDKRRSEITLSLIGWYHYHGTRDYRQTTDQECPSELLWQISIPSPIHNFAICNVQGGKPPCVGVSFVL